MFSIWNFEALYLQKNHNGILTAAFDLISVLGSALGLLRDRGRGKGLKF